MATTPKVINYEEWLKLPETEGVEEVVQGKIRKIPPNKWNHARICRRIGTPTSLKSGWFP